MHVIALLVAPLLIIASLPASSAETATDGWFLMARHGECAPVQSLARKVPELGRVSDPQAFIQLMRSQGLRVESRALGPSSGAAMEVLVPERGLALIFAPAAHCSRIERR